MSYDIICTVINELVNIIGQLQVVIVAGWMTDLEGAGIDGYGNGYYMVYFM